MANIDLHIHTNCSDGDYTPLQIVDMAKTNNVSTISICDHDTIEAYSKELIDYAKKENINLIYGVEMSTRYYGVGIHVLGYNFDLKNSKLLECLSKLKNARLDYLMNVSKLLNSIGYIIDVDKLKGLKTVTKAHIANDIISNPINKNLLIKTFSHIPNKGEFIETTMNENCPAYVEKFSISPIEASKIIKEAGGKVVLAHPVAYIHEDNVSVSQIENLLKEMNADGVEANYIYVNRNNEIIDECDFWNSLAKDKNLFTTIGSDFHSIDNIHPNIGFKDISIKFSPPKKKIIINHLKKSSH